MDRRRDVGVGLDVFPPEDDIIHGERHTIRPLEALAEVEGQFGAVRVPFPAFGQTRLNRIVGVTRPTQHRVVDQTAKAVEVIHTAPAAIPDAAVHADGIPFGQRDNTGILGQTLVNRGQFSRGHLFGQRGASLYFDSCAWAEGKTGTDQSSHQHKGDDYKNRRLLDIVLLLKTKFSNGREERRMRSFYSSASSFLRKTPSYGALARMISLGSITISSQLSSHPLICSSSNRMA